MADVWYDPNGSNTAPYDTQAKAATNLQTAVNTAGGAAGNNLYTVARAVETLAATIDVNVGSGDLTSGYINWIGVNTSGVDDGTRFVMDGNNAATNCILINKNYWKFKNLELKNATGDGFNTAATGDYLTLENIYSHNNGARGFDMAASILSTLDRCRAENNTAEGILLWAYNIAHFCTAIGNGGRGFYLDLYAQMIGCLSHNNTTSQILARQGSAIFNCIVDGWNGSAAAGVGIAINAVNIAIRGTRITNNATGISLTGADFASYDFCGTYGNTAVSNIPAGCQLIDLGNNVAMADDKYVGGRGGGGTDNFNLASDAELRNTQIAIDATNNFYIAAGLPPIAGAGGGLLSNRGMTGGING